MGSKIGSVTAARIVAELKSGKLAISDVGDRVPEVTKELQRSIPPGTPKTHRDVMLLAALQKVAVSLNGATDRENVEAVATTTRHFGAKADPITGLGQLVGLEAARAIIRELADGGQEGLSLFGQKPGVSKSVWDPKAEFTEFSARHFGAKADPIAGLGQLVGLEEARAKVRALADGGQEGLSLFGQKPGVSKAEALKSAYERSGRAAVIVGAEELLGKFFDDPAPALMAKFFDDPAVELRKLLEKHNDKVVIVKDVQPLLESLFGLVTLRLLADHVVSGSAPTVEFSNAGQTSEAFARSVFRPVAEFVGLFSDLLNGGAGDLSHRFQNRIEFDKPESE
jgi:hypothetical protein